jgi:amino acid transporter
MAVDTARLRRPASGTRTHLLRRDVGLTGLLFASLGSIIGSGWLFGALYAAQEAGPAALVSWGIGGAFVLLLALIHAELGGAYPIAGGSARFPHYSYGTLVGFGIGWIAWLGAVTTAPIEVEAALQYFTHYASWLTTTHGGETVLTAQGYAVAAALMLVFTIVNILGVRKLARSNNAIMIWKIAIPVLTIAVLLALAFHGGNFHAAGGFNPYGFHGIFSAISTGGVIFAYLGFEQAIQLGGEGSNPRRNIPLAVIGAMVFGVVLYLLLQFAFLGALDPHNLRHGWSKLAFNGLVGPFAGLASAVGIGWLAILLYIDAAVSPGGTGLLYTGTSSRLFYAMSRERFLWTPLSTLNSRRVPVFSIVVSFCVGMILFLPFPGWQKLVGFITSATVLAYALAPLALGALRRQDPQRDRPFRLPLSDPLACAGFVVANLIIYWSGWTVVWRLMVAVAIGFVLLAVAQATKRGEKIERFDLRSSLWLWPYLGGMALITALGQYDGVKVIPFWWDLAVVAAFSLAIYVLAISLRLPDARTQALIEAVSAEAQEEEALLEGDADEPLQRDETVDERASAEEDREISARA